jgi:hypothetical protein
VITEIPKLTVALFVTLLAKLAQMVMPNHAQPAKETAT